MGYHFAIWAASIQRTVVSLCCMYQILIHFSPWRFTCHAKLILWQLAHDSAVLDFFNLWKRKHMLKHRNVHSKHSVWVTDSFIAWKVNNNFNFLLHGWICERARWGESCVLIGYPSRQDRTSSGFPALVLRGKSSLFGHIINPLLSKPVRSWWLNISLGFRLGQ